ncbi:MAG: hypothetical protein ACK4OO_04810, partial [bacterium]
MSKLTRYVVQFWFVGLMASVGMVSTIWADEFVYGEVSGVWSINRSPFVVVGEITIPEGASLTIEPGVEIFFAGSYAFNVRGRLSAVGGNDEARRITISGRPTVEWRGIFFFPEADARSQIVNCDIRGAHIGIDLNRSFVTIRGCRIEARFVGINCLGTTSEISYNLLIRAYDPNSLYDVKAISVRTGSAPLIVGNQLVEAVAQGGGEAFGIYVSESSPIIRENWIEAESDYRALSIFISRAEKADIYHNIIRGRSSGVIRGVWTVQSTGVRLVNNTIHSAMTSDNAVGVVVDRGAEVVLINNIIVGNGLSIGDSTVYGQVHRSSGWNAYWAHKTVHAGEWSGGEGEVTEDPYFENLSPIREEADYRLRWDDYPHGRRSPCIDAGYPQMEDPDGTRSDIGRFYYEHEPNFVTPDKESHPQTPFLVEAYPNPFNASLNIVVRGGAVQGREIKVYDLTGRLASIIRIWEDSG